MPTLHPIPIRRRARYLRMVSLTIALLLLSFAPSAAEARAEFSTTQLPWPVISLRPLPHTFTAPVFVTHTGDDRDRIFIVEKGGRIHIWQDGALLDPPFLDFGEPNSEDNPVDSSCGECGLLSVAFPPDFATSGYFFVYYNSKEDRIAPPDESDVGDRTREGNNGADSVIARFRVRDDNPNQADLGSEETILLVNQPYSNHNGGQITFGPDGYLYIGLGDGGSGGDPLEAGQRLDTLLGKLLRIDVSDYDAYTPVEPYAIPAGNPFVNASTAAQGPGGPPRPEIWAYGLRNPWRFSFDRTTGNLYIGDVGQGEWEEIDFQPAASTGGENYGWDIVEGPDCYDDGSDEPCDREGLTAPIVTYNHSMGCSVSGGYVYRGPSAPVLQGVYLFSDYCSGRIWGARQVGGEWEDRVLLNTSLNAVSFGEDQAGNLYIVDIISGLVYRLQDISQKKYLPFVGS